MIMSELRGRGRRDRHRGDRQSHIYPLPHQTQLAFEQFQRTDPRCKNPGLLFDRYTAYRPGWSLDSDGRRNPKYEALKAVRDTRMDATLHRAFVARWQAALTTLGAETFEAEPDWRFVVGLGRKGPLEVGMTFHRIYGFPLVPGSSLKGLARAYAELVAKASEDEITHVFGDTPGPGEDPSVAHVGRAVFFDAVPTRPPHLEIDVMNPHYADYYQGNSPPADYLSPTPIYFLTVGRGGRYLFAVAGPEKAQALAWLEGGLSELGSGAKTTSGYGYWEKVAEEQARPDVVSKPRITEPEVPPGYQRGRVKNFGLGPEKSYGFIFPKAGGAEIFVHRSDLAEGATFLEEGQEVIFKVVQTPKGPQAEDVRPYYE
jgi:CRISPR-associated protein Cmr6